MSGALWVTLLWMLIIGTRPVSLWLGGGLHVENPEDYAAGSPLDRSVFLCLIVVGLVVLFKRRVDWGKIYKLNPLFFIFFIYWGMSIFWSDYPFVSLKRWIKDFGNVIMVLLILTEKNPVEAIKAVFIRFAYIVIPLSVVFIKFVPEIGRYYNRWTWQPGYCGVATNKNELGLIAFISGLFLIYELVDRSTAVDTKMSNMDLLGRILLLLMVFWLLIMAQSSTSLVSLIIGVGVLFIMRRPIARKRIQYFGSYMILITIIFIFLYSVPSISKAIVGMLGRDITLTGRTLLWADLLREPINPLIGTGYKSFWLKSVVGSLWEKYTYIPHQAHNGYIETYLNGGWIGVGILIAMIISTGSKVKKDLLYGSNDGILNFSILITVVLYNITEAAFNGLTLVWIMMIIAALHHPYLQVSIVDDKV
jgi:O-antigen ligase